MTAVVAMTFIMSIPCLAQPMAHRIFFVDKGPDAFTPGSALYRSTLEGFHPDAIERRQLLGMDPLLTERDRPVYQPYVDLLSQLGVTTFARSNWRNMVIADLDVITAAMLRANSSVIARVEEIASSGYTPFGIVSDDDAQLPDCDPPRYGDALATVDKVDAQPLHQAGVYGQGAVVGLIDVGFRWKTIPPLQHVNVRGEYDVIYGDANTSNEENDPSGQDGHGTLVLSVLAGYAADSLIGIAPGATVLLAKSEDLRWERRVEEDHYAIAVEWLERNGADIITSSLGYRPFDSTEAPFLYQHLDGKTTTAARAVNMASTLGVICITAAGNFGPSDSTLITPSDADSVIAVGGVLRSGQPTAFSSSGPTADGRIKPDLAALGAKVRAAGTGDRAFVASDGTSMATPAIAGAFALLRSIYPEVEPWTIRRAVFETAQFPFTMDSAIGHGTPSMIRAANRLGPGPVRPSVVVSEGRRYVIATVFNESAVTCTLRLRRAGNSDTSWTEIAPSKSEHPSYVFPLDDGISQGVIEYQLVASDGPRTRTWPYRGVGTFPISGSDVSCGATLSTIITSVPSAAPTHAVRIAPNVISDGRSAVRMLGMDRPPHTVRILSSIAGTEAPTSWAMTDGGASVMLNIRDLASGHYVAVAIMHDGRSYTAPFIIVD